MNRKRRKEKKGGGGGVKSEVFRFDYVREVDNEIMSDGECRVWA